MTLITKVIKSFLPGSETHFNAKYAMEHVFPMPGSPTKKSIKTLMSLHIS